MSALARSWGFQPNFNKNPVIFYSEIPRGIMCCQCIHIHESHSAENACLKEEKKHFSRGRWHPSEAMIPRRNNQKFKGEDAFLGGWGFKPGMSPAVFYDV